MKPIDRDAYIERYERRLREHGPTPEALGWGKEARQDVRFAVLAAPALVAPESRVLDVGCGFADLYGFLSARGWRGRYTGVDLVPGLLAEARRRHPDLDLRQLDVTSSEHLQLDGDFDLAVASGVFNAALEAGDNQGHIRKGLANLLAHAEVVAVDFLSTWVDFRQDGAWHTDPAWAFETGRGLTRRLALRLDYMPYEFALFLYRDATISERNVFAGHETAPAASA